MCIRYRLGVSVRERSGEECVQAAAALSIDGTEFRSVLGYAVDHARALECGSADAPSNMQWQTVAAGKAKDRTERYCR